MPKEVEVLACQLVAVSLLTIEGPKTSSFPLGRPFGVEPKGHGRNRRYSQEDMLTRILKTDLCALPAEHFPGETTWWGYLPA